MKKTTLVWLVLVILFAVGGGVWWSMLKDAPVEIEDPGLEIADDLEIPDPE
ncbi:MAG: CcoQ/FixQ family Cbb3-type cytochrome c oxidase assembly chaperone [Verrucomicrobiaceae bacterium]